MEELFFRKFKMKTNREKILHNMYLHECEKSERMKSFKYRMRLQWHNFKKRIAQWVS